MTNEQPKQPPKADPQPWHAESIRAWEKAHERSEVGREDRKKLREEWENRSRTS